MHHACLEWLEYSDGSGWLINSKVFSDSFLSWLGFLGGFLCGEVSSQRPFGGRRQESR